MGFNSEFKGLINVLYVNKQEFSALSWRSNQGQICLIFGIVFSAYHMR